MTPPNVILINCDDLGYGDLGCYGSDRNNTPHLDRLAAEGKRFTDFYMASAVCSPSRAAMMTGCYPPRIGLNKVLGPGDELGLNPEETTVAQNLKDRGYATKIVGKWHCGDQPEFLPTQFGFDDYFGVPYSNDMGRQRGNDGTIKERPPLPLLHGSGVVEEQPDQRGITERYTVEATEFIRAHRDRPFFLYLAHMYVHVPLFIPKPFLERSRNGAYGGAVECIDWSTGIILDQLKQLGLDDNTLVIFTSDNGSRAREEGGSNYPCRGHKAQTWDGGIRVPCIMRWPGRIKPGSVCDELTRSIDFMPTLTGLAGGETDNRKPIDGVDISDLIFHEDRPAPNDTFAYYTAGSLAALRVGEWKLHFHRREEKDLQELYNLHDDIGETNNRYDDEPDVVARLRKRADEVRAELGDSDAGVTGSGQRPGGHCKSPVPLTEYRENGPYFIAEYDLADMPTMSG
jgi:arylsulfatase A